MASKCKKSSNFLGISYVLWLLLFAKAFLFQGTVSAKNDSTEAVITGQPSLNDVTTISSNPATLPAETTQISNPTSSESVANTTSETTTPTTTTVVNPTSSSNVTSPFSTISPATIATTQNSTSEATTTTSTTSAPNITTTTLPVATTTGIPDSTTTPNTTTAASTTTQIVPTTPQTDEYDPYANARRAGIGSFFALVVVIGVVGGAFWYYRWNYTGSSPYMQQGGPFGPLALRPGSNDMSPPPPPPPGNFRFAMGPTNNSTYNFMPSDEPRQRSSNGSSTPWLPGFDPTSIRRDPVRPVESFDPFDPRSNDEGSEGQFVNKNDNVQL